MLFGQTFEPHDLVLVGLLTVLEGVLSIDNALVLGLLAGRLPRRLQGRALSYGLIGAFVFRLIAILTAVWLLKWRVVKLLGGLYLLYVPIKHFYHQWRHGPQKEEHPDHDPHHGLTDEQVLSTHSRKFWWTVATIELTDIAFAIDSILAAIALVGSAPAGSPKNAAHPKLWIVLLGGMLGVILMRFAAALFIALLRRFPRFQTAAYLLVLVIGAKLLADWGFNTPAQPHRVDFHSPHNLAFWAFWISMTLCFLSGFLPKKKSPASEPAGEKESPVADQSLTGE